MLYSFAKTENEINGELPVHSIDALSFVYEVIALCEKADVKIENIHDESLAAIYDDAGVQSNFYDNHLYLSKKPINNSGVLIKDFSAYPDFAIPFAVVCAAKGILADLKGLEAFTKGKGTGLIADFQKEIYRFNVNTDFCDYSKLKIYNTKEMKPKSKPVNTGANYFLSTLFIPLAFVFGKIEIEMPDDFEEKTAEIISLFNELKISFQKL